MVLLSTLQHGQVLTFNTPALPPRTLVPTLIEGREAISQPYRYDLEMVSAAAEIDAEALLRSPAWIGIKQPIPTRGGSGAGVQTVKIQGVLTSFEMSDRDARGVHYRATLVPRLSRLGMTMRSRIFLDQSVLEILETVLRESGLAEAGKDYELRTRSEYGKREYVVQYQESDLAFISRLMEHEGIFYFFEEGEETERLVIADSSDAHRPLRGPSTLPYRPQEGSRGAWQESAQQWFQVEVVRGVTARKNLTPSEIVLQDYNYRTPSTDLKVSQTVAEGGFGTVYEYGNHYKDEEEGKRLARIRAEEFRCREWTYAGTSDGKSLRAGATFALSEHFNRNFNRSLLVAELRVRAEQTASVQSEGAAGAGTAAGYEAKFHAIPAETVFRPERRTPRPKIPGAINARVDASGDGKYAEIDSEGRYKVVAPFDLSGRGNGTASRFIRMAQPYAGTGMGMHFPLHKGTEVALTHVNGDPDRPVIAAAVTNPETRSPVVGENQTQCMIHSGGNNAIRFEDAEGQEQVFVHAQKHYHIRIRGSEREWVGGNRHLIVHNDQYERVHGERHHIVEKNDIHQVKGDQHLSIQGMSAVGIGGTLSLRVDGDVAELFGAHHTEETLGDWQLKASNLVLEATGSVSIACGGSNIVLDASGVTLKGPQIVLDGGAVKIGSGPGSPPLSYLVAEAAAPLPPLEARAPGTIERTGALHDGTSGEEQGGMGPEPSGRSWISFELKDDDGNPVPREYYVVRLPSGHLRAGYLDREGKTRVEGIQAGTCKISFPRIDDREWQ